MKSYSPEATRQWTFAARQKHRKKPGSNAGLLGGHFGNVTKVVAGGSAVHILPLRLMQPFLKLNLAAHLLAHRRSGRI
jgi:hypothetical protein